MNFDYNATQGKDQLEIQPNRTVCYHCYRPQTSCMCEYIQPIKTQTKFVILMHPKEFRKTKNGTGHMTNKSLINSEIYIGIDFTSNNRINELINNPNNACYLLYPDENSLNLNTQSAPKDKNIIIFILDSTWACSKKMLRVSQNIKSLPKVSFTHTKNSLFAIKRQPLDLCLSTIESTLCVLELLTQQNIEVLSSKELNNFLSPFKNMVSYQIDCAKRPSSAVRFKKTTTQQLA